MSDEALSDDLHDCRSLGPGEEKESSRILGNKVDSVTNLRIP